MDEKMNIAGIGKRMPYKTPDGVFDDIEHKVLSATGCERKTPLGFRAVGIALAVAASLTLIVMLSWHREQVPANSLADVQTAFDGLDNADREFLSEIYNEDTFMNINY